MQETLYATISEACLALQKGKAVIFPTDTVYGVGVSVRHATSPAILYGLKQRDERKPIAWLVGAPCDLARFGRDVPLFAQILARTFWPGPLTLIVKAGDEVPPAFRSAENTIGLRMPQNKTILSLLQAVASPIATSSANMAGRQAVVAAGELDPALVAKVACVLADDTEKSGTASTILDCTGDHPVVLRRGGLSIADIRALC